MRLAMLMLGLAVVVILTTSGCTAVRAAHARPNVTDSRGIIWNDTRCFDLLQTADNWTFAAKLLVGTGGSAAVAAPVGGAISDDEKEQNRIRWGLGISAAVSSGAGLAALWMGERKRDEFEEYCQVDAVKPETVDPLINVEPPRPDIPLVSADAYPEDGGVE